MKPLIAPPCDTASCPWRGCSASPKPYGSVLPSAVVVGVVIIRYDSAETTRPLPRAALQVSRSPTVEHSPPAANGTAISMGVASTSSPLSTS